PTWAKYGMVAIANVAYEVASRDSSTQLTLSVNSNPGADIAAGTAYTIFRDTYPLPVDFVAAGSFNEASGNHFPVYVGPRDWMDRERTNRSPSTPSVYTFMADQNYMGAMVVKFRPPPNAVYQYDYLYMRRPRELNYEEVSAGTVSVTGTGV